MPPKLFDDPRFIPSSRFRRKATQLEFAEKADLWKSLAGLLMAPFAGERQPDGNYRLIFGSYCLRYSLSDEDDPHTKISLEGLLLV